MIAIPAVDLREGACVQLVGGSYEDERVRLNDPVRVAARWADLGFRRLHVVDLDAATGRGDNSAVISALLRDTRVAVQVGGGVRNADRIAELLGAGAIAAVVGTRAVEDAAWLSAVATQFRGKLVVAADVRERRIVTRGWQQTLDEDVGDAVERLSELPLAGLLVTAVHLEGQLRGTDLPLMAEVARRSKVPVTASGGITTLDDLRRLSDVGIASAVLGMALYTNALDAALVAKEFGS